MLVFCESYPEIKNALYLAKQSYHDQSVTIIIPWMNDLYKFFNLVNERAFQSRLNVVYFDVYRGPLAKKGNRIIKALYLLPSIVKERQHLKDLLSKHFAHLRGADVFFFTKYFNPSTFYWLNKLSKTNRLVYMPDPAYDAVSMENTTPTNIIELVYLVKCKLVYGYDISLGKHPLGQMTTRMPDKFFRERVAKVISQEERDSMLQTFDVSKLNVFDGGNYSVMYFHEELVEDGYVSDFEAYEKILTDVFDILGKYFRESKVARKYHPNSRANKTMIRFGELMPDFIPAEFLYNEKVKMYLGISSMALANVKKGLAVSLIDLVTFKNDTIKETLKKYLIQLSRSKVLFPKSLDEFERILVSINQEGNKFVEGAK